MKKTKTTKHQNLLKFQNNLEEHIITNSRSSITHQNNTASGTVMMETTVCNTVGIRPMSVRMETTARIETPDRMEMRMQMFKTSELS